MSGKGIRSFVLYFLVFISALLAMDSPVSAFVVSTTGSGVEIKWPIPSASYFLNTSGSPSGSLESIQTALQTWSDVPNSSFVFAYAGATTSSSHGNYDGHNIVTFAPMGYTGVLAENIKWYYVVTGQIVDSDIRFNTGYSWSTSGSPDFFDVQSIATHELGHSLSLGDLYGVADSEKTMYGYATDGETKKRTLDPDDIAGIAYLYPGRSLIGVFRNGMWFLDTNGNGAWDGTDTIAYFGLPGDVQVTGDWDGTGVKKIGVFRNGQWYLDNGDGAWAWGTTDTFRIFGLPGDVPVTGDWDGTGTTKIGVFRNGVWYLDMDGDGTWNPAIDMFTYFGLPGDVPVTGDWTGTGTTKIGVFRNGQWYLDNGDGAWAWGTDTYTNFGLPGDVPVTGDWTGTGTTKIGVFRIGQWYLDMDGDGAWNPTNDMFTYFGLPGDVPVTGDW